MNLTQQVARGYYDAWTSGDRRTVTDIAAFAGAGDRG
jgi:hypothetical protein